MPKEQSELFAEFSSSVDSILLQLDKAERQLNNAQSEKKLTALTREYTKKVEEFQCNFVIYMAALNPKNREELYGSVKFWFLSLVETHPELSINGSLSKRLGMDLVILQEQTELFKRHYENMEKILNRLSFKTRKQDKKEAAFVQEFKAAMDNLSLLATEEQKEFYYKMIGLVFSFINAPGLAPHRLTIFLSGIDLDLCEKILNDLRRADQLCRIGKENCLDDRISVLGQEKVDLFKKYWNLEAIKRQFLDMQDAAKKVAIGEILEPGSGSESESESEPEGEDYPLGWR